MKHLLDIGFLKASSDKWLSEVTLKMKTMPWVHRSARRLAAPGRSRSRRSEEDPEGNRQGTSAFEEEAGELGSGRKSSGLGGRGGGDSELEAEVGDEGGRFSNGTHKYILPTTRILCVNNTKRESVRRFFLPPFVSVVVGTRPQICGTTNVQSYQILATFGDKHSRLQN